MPFRAPDTLPSPPTDLLLGASLFLDFDGTLVDIAPTPDGVAVDPALRSTLDRLSQTLEGRVALISGRAAGYLRDLFAPDAPTVAGSHGVELHWADGRVESPAPPEALAQARTAMERFAASRPGTLVEHKLLGVALHFRQAPAMEAACRRFAEALATETGLLLQPGKMLFELRVAGGDKGAALQTLLASPAMTGTRPVFLGDDETDEPAFAAAEALGGAGVLVGPPRATQARYRLGDVAQVREWLDQACREAA